MSQCDHEVVESEDIVVQGPGHIMSTCANCQREIWAKKIDHQWFKDSGEVVVLEWEVA